MVINHNMSALFTDRQLFFNNIQADKDMEKLSSGQRINRAGD
ncbi:MAG TPA: flagellin, partial [Spirochaetia bacterium]|nr:flagellin [Spirochaetia bacterium]